VEVGRDQVTISLRIALEPLIAGIDLSAVDDTNDAPEAAIYDRLRALGPEALEAALRDAWPRVSQGLLIFVDGERLMPEITDLQIPAAGDLDLPRDSILTVAPTFRPGMRAWRSASPPVGAPSSRARSAVGRTPTKGFSQVAN
jgi:hypothetical protein